RRPRWLRSSKTSAPSTLRPSISTCRAALAGTEYLSAGVHQRHTALLTTLGSQCGHVCFLSASQTLSLAPARVTLYNVRQEQYTPLLTGAHTMARTGNPRGRPKGSGLRLGAQQTRVTIRIPQALYDRLDAYAAGRHFTRGTTQLADCVRELLEHALACPYKRQ